jgi:hypothetical protein
VPPGTLLLHCNGGHYYRASSTYCPWSGYDHPHTAAIIELAARRTADTYEALLDAGMEEALVMDVLVVPADNPDPDAWVCSATAPAELVELVVQRNTWLLQRFPSGSLAAALVRRPRVERVYRELPGQGSWILVDPGSSRRSPPAMSRILEEAVAGGSRPDGRLVSVMVDAEFPPLAIDPRCWARQPSNHPLIPTGHLLLHHGIEAGAA